MVVRARRDGRIAEVRAVGRSNGACLYDATQAVVE